MSVYIMDDSNDPSRLRKELGQIPLVTPTSQIVGIQTVNNVLFDTPEERYKMITGQVKDLCYGLYGKTAVPIDPEVVLGGDDGSPIVSRNADSPAARAYGSIAYQTATALAKNALEGRDKEESFFIEWGK